MDSISYTGFDWADIIEDASDQAGGKEVTAADVTKARRAFRLLTERWTAKGYNTWRISQVTVGPVNGSTPQFLLPVDCDDVIQVTSSVEVLGSESPMTRVSPDQYAHLSDKLTQGRPAQYYLDRDGEAPSLFVYPIGSANTVTHMTVTYVRRPAAFDRYDPALDIPGRWLEAVVKAMAHSLAVRRPPYDETLIARLARSAESAEQIASDADRGRYSHNVRLA